MEPTAPPFKMPLHLMPEVVSELSNGIGMLPREYMSFSTIPLPNSNLSSDLINNATVPWWDGFYTYGTTFNLTAALANTSSENYALLVYDMDVIAWKLLELQAYNIPIIWRPLHEADGGWFWWGAYGPESCIELYKLMFDRYTRVWGLRNLIWLWNSMTPSWYPGSNIVDILGYDSYPAIGDFGPVDTEYEELIALGNNTKSLPYPKWETFPILRLRGCIILIGVILLLGMECISRMIRIIRSLGRSIFIIFRRC
jgi:hypothetical protein